ncbi:Ras-related and estrogen-regulated growth inhibitor [Merluccius polli]|uniref:small monomeric GTPase n=1 Tax=Merluccius polli TaxID=89951 RepID=A0AA47NY90_MERPO|nr:Ras-related and estrogen-regulated growth inhibitor [Merluccius polli]
MFQREGSYGQGSPQVSPQVRRLVLSGGVRRSAGRELCEEEEEEEDFELDPVWDREPVVVLKGRGDVVSGAGKQGPTSGSANESASRKMVPVKLLVLGTQDTGKTEMTYRCHRVVDQEPVNLEILDRTSKDGCPASVESCIRWADGFLLLYSITQRASFLEVAPMKKLIDHIKQSPVSMLPIKKLIDHIKQSPAPTVLIANKADLETGREVRTEEGQNLAKDLRCSFKELSVSETVVAVEAAVFQLISLVTAQQRPPLPDRPSYMLTVRHALTRKLIRSKTMQW